MRSHSSVRFAPYYKVQWLDPIIVAWRDVQQQFPTPEAAQAAFLPGKQCRIMAVTEQGRTVLTH